jgi:hypothetical protein
MNSWTADALRALVGRRDFNSRHTLVTEYLFPEQRKATKRLDRRIKQVKRTFTRKDNPEGAELVVKRECRFSHLQAVWFGPCGRRSGSTDPGQPRSLEQAKHEEDH